MNQKKILSRFAPRLATPSEGEPLRGYASGMAVSMTALADSVFGRELPGTWLLAYMIRRFGWPNAGSDPHKNLCSWLLTTRIPGLYLHVTPYLGEGNYHFAVRFTEKVGAQFDLDPGRAAMFARKERALLRWWNATGKKLYCWGLGKRQGDKDELVHAYGSPNGKPNLVWGLWRRKPTHKGMDRLPMSDGHLDGMTAWWIEQFLRATHPEVRIPRMTKSERARRHSAFCRKGVHALREAMRALLVPTSVRDLGFNAFGRTDKGGDPLVATARGAAKVSTIFSGAGYAPEAYFALPKTHLDRADG